MKDHLKPSWSDDEKAAGARLRDAWEEFFSASQEEVGEEPEAMFPASDEERRIAQVRSRHEARLLAYPNVVGVSEGVRTRKGKPTGERCLVVYVTRKIPSAKLGGTEVLPSELEGVAVDVVEVGTVEALPT
jgi:hypothetical protein